MNQWWKKKLARLGYKQYPVTVIEGVCPLCGKTDMLFRATGAFNLCQSCYRRLLDSNVEHVVKRVVMPTGAICHNCRKHIVVVNIVSNTWVCLKCMWKRLGGQKGVMKAEGERLWW